MENPITDTINKEATALSLEEISTQVEKVIQKEEDIYGGVNVVIPVNPPMSDTVSALNANEDGDALLFVNLQKNRFCFDHSLGQWFKWSGYFWEEDAVGDVFSALDSVVDKYSLEYDRQSWNRKQATLNQNITDMKKAEELEKKIFKRMFDLQGVYRKRNILFLVAQGSNSLGIAGDEWDKNPYLLGCKNGTINLQTCEFRDGQPEDYIKTVAPTEWKGIDEPAPAWESFLKTIFNGSDDLVSYIQRLLGYGITGSTKDHVIAVFWGANGRNGKGTLLETLRFVLGHLISPIQAEMLTGDYQNRSSAGPSPDIMSLQGRRLVWASETEEGHRFAVGKIKWLTGADTLTGRAPFGKKNITFLPTHKIILLTNHRPQLTSMDRAIWERLHLVPFDLSFVDNPQEDFQRKRDPDLPEKLKSEASGILAWLVRGCLEWQKVGLQPPAKVLETTAQYKADEDVVGQFLHECTLKDPNEIVRAQALYNTYRSWCERCGCKYLTMTKFGGQIKERFEKGSDSKGHFYKGLCLILDLQEVDLALEDGGADYA